MRASVLTSRRSTSLSRSLNSSNLPRSSPSYTGILADDEYRRIFAQASGIYGSTRDYAEATHTELLRLGIYDRALARIVALSKSHD